MTDTITTTCPTCEGQVTHTQEERDVIANHYGDDCEVMCHDCAWCLDTDDMSMSDLVLNKLNEIVEFELTDASRHTFDYPFTYSTEMMNSIMAEHEARTKTKLEEFDREFNAESDTYCGLDFDWATGEWA